MMPLLTRRGALRAGLATPVAAALPGAALAQASPTAQGAGFYRFRLGDLRCAVVSDGSLTTEAPVQASLAINATPEAVGATLAERFLPADRGTLHFNALLIETAERKVLVDTGSRSAMGPSTGKLIANLRSAGVAPEQIDTVVISHAHPDHLFGVLDAAGALAFPAARVLVGGAEHAFWTGDADLSRSPINPSLKRMVTDGAREHLGAIAARLELVGPDPGLTHEISPINAQGVVSEGVARKQASCMHFRLIDWPSSSPTTIGACLSFERRLEVTDLMRRPWAQPGESVSTRPASRAMGTASASTPHFRQKDALPPSSPMPPIWCWATPMACAMCSSAAWRRS